METRNQSVFFSPTILEDVTPSMTGFSEEFFGHVLIANWFDDLEEAISLAANPTYGLSGNIYKRDDQQ